jgi:hypothetical protein
MRHFEEARSETENAEVELRRVQQQLQRAREAMLAWATLARLEGHDVDGPATAKAAAVRSQPTIAELMRQYMLSHAEEAPFSPRAVHLGVEREYGRKLSPAAVTTTRDRHPEVFRKTVGPRGAFVLVDGLSASARSSRATSESSSRE